MPKRNSNPVIGISDGMVAVIPLPKDCANKMSPDAGICESKKHNNPNLQAVEMGLFSNLKLMEG